MLSDALSPHVGIAPEPLLCSSGNATLPLSAVLFGPRLWKTRSAEIDLVGGTGDLAMKHRNLQTKATDGRGFQARRPRRRAANGLRA